MRLTIQNAQNESIFEIEIEDSGVVEDIKALIEVETGIILAN